MKWFNDGMRVLALCLCSGFTVLAADVPLQLPKPDGKPGDQSKPVKVYILAGQSNMFGFGRLDGASPRYGSIMLSADPNVIPGVFNMPKQELRKIMRHCMYQQATGEATGATVAIYKGAYDPDVDYASMKPVKQTTAALGTVSATLPAVDGPHTLVAKAFIEVPESGTYSLRAGYESSSRSVVTLDGKEVYRKINVKQPAITKVELEAGKRYPITVTYAQGGSAAFWMEQTGLDGHGDLTKLTQRDNKYTWFVDDEGNWTERKDVIYIDTRTKKEAGGLLLSPTVNGDGKHIGPEIPFGYVMGTYHDEPVLLIESSMGNRALYWDFRPPSSGRPNPDSQWEGLEYRLMVEGVQYALENIDKIVPGYQGQGYEIVGFAWWQGHKDQGQSKAEYEKHLVNLIQDLRKDLNAPDMLAAVASVGFHGWNLPSRWQGVFEAQMAVGDPEQHPEFAGNVASIDTRGYWRSADKSPTGTDYHYNHNAETYTLTGDALARAMVQMLGGDVEMRAQPEEPASAPSAPEPTAEQVAASKAALEPMIVDGMLAQQLHNERMQKSVRSTLQQERPETFGRRWNQFLNDTVDRLINYYQEIGVHKYDWQDFGPAIRTGEWQYYSFDPPEKLAIGSSRFRDITLPEGMENWMAPGFDAAAAGFKTGNAPFGNLNGEPKPLRKGCPLHFCGCSETPGTLWENEVLLMRTTVRVPDLKEGHRYRIVVGGSAHVNAGEGFELYANGKRIGKSTVGVGKRQGWQPRGAPVYADLREEFSGGTVTLAAKSFLRYMKTPAGKQAQNHISVWLQEQKLPEPILAIGEAESDAE